MLPEAAAGEARLLGLRKEQLRDPNARDPTCGEHQVTPIAAVGAGATGAREVDCGVGGFVA